jgi:hypothetical protein
MLLLYRYTFESKFKRAYFGATRTKQYCRNQDILEERKKQNNLSNLIYYMFTYTSLHAILVGLSADSL